MVYDMNMDSFVRSLPEDVCVVIVGLSGSGKSTLAEELSSRLGEGSLMSSDYIREVEMEQEVYNPWQSRAVFSKLHERLRDRLQQGLPCVVDSTAVAYGQRLGFVDIAEEFARPVVVVVCDLDPDVAWERNVLRGESGGRFVPQDAFVIQQQHLGESKASFVTEMEKHNYINIYVVDDDHNFQVEHFGEVESR